MPSDQDCKPILIRPPIELRSRLEDEAQKQNRSLSNLIVVMLTKMFRAIDRAGNGEKS
jgi:hypothetical protein